MRACDLGEMVWPLSLMPVHTFPPFFTRLPHCSSSCSPSQQACCGISVDPVGALLRAATAPSEAVPAIGSGTGSDMSRGQRHSSRAEAPQAEARHHHQGAAGDHQLLQRQHLPRDREAPEFAERGKAHLDDVCHGEGAEHLPVQCKVRVLQCTVAVRTVFDPLRVVAGTSLPCGTCRARRSRGGWNGGHALSTN